MVDLPRLHVVFFRTAAGREPVREWLKDLSPADRKVLGTDIYTVQRAWPVGRPLAAHLRSEIWEVRSSLDNREARVLFGIAGDRVVLLHGFIKKTGKTPYEDLELAERRWKARQGQWQQGAQDE